jgi:hypothetical protein
MSQQQISYFAANTETTAEKAAAEDTFKEREEGMVVSDERIATHIARAIAVAVAATALVRGREIVGRGDCKSSKSECGEEFQVVLHL